MPRMTKGVPSGPMKCRPLVCTKPVARAVWLPAMDAVSGVVSTARASSGTPASSDRKAKPKRAGRRIMVTRKYVGRAKSASICLFLEGCAIGADKFIGFDGVIRIEIERRITPSRLNPIRLRDIDPDIIPTHQHLLRFRAAAARIGPMLRKSIDFPAIRVRMFACRRTPLTHQLLTFRADPAIQKLFISGGRRKPASAARQGQRQTERQDRPQSVAII